MKRRLRRSLAAVAAAAGMTLALIPAAPAEAHETVAPTDCGFDHGCSYKHAHFDTKIWSPSSLGGQCSDDFPDSINDELSSVYNHETNNLYGLFKDNNQSGNESWLFGNNARRAHFSTLPDDFDNEASSCEWF